ncbi:hypothetical protein D3C71_1418610 [compost metagenome]
MRLNPEFFEHCTEQWIVMLIKYNKATVHRDLFAIYIQLMGIGMAAKVIILFKDRDLMCFA